MSQLDRDRATLLLTANTYWKTVQGDYELKTRYGVPIARARAARQSLLTGGIIDHSNAITDQGLIVQQALEEHLPMREHDEEALMYLSAFNWGRNADNVNIPGRTTRQVILAINNLIRLGLAQKMTYSGLTEYNLTDFGREVAADISG